MRERLLVLALAAGALGLFYVLLFPKPQSLSSQEIVFPLSTESRPQGYLAVWRWLAGQHVPVMSLRYRYDRLPGLLPRPTGNLLLMSVPQRVPARAPELAVLNRWVAAGNTLLILAALDDTPLWALAGDPLFEDKLKRLTGLHVTTSRSRFTIPPRLDALTGTRLSIQPRGDHPLLAGVQHITALSQIPPGLGEVDPPEDGAALELAERTDKRDPALWVLRRGAGQIILLSVASPFSNAAVALGDNARLLANIIAWCCSAGGTVVFDDAHQGLTAYYDGKAFFADPRLHRTFGWILLLWLAFVVGALPLRAVRRTWQPLDETTYVEASARYLAAVVPPPEAAQGLIERFLGDLPAPAGTEIRGLWERFDAHPRVSARQRRALHTLYERACSGHRVPLAYLQRLLAELRKNLQ